MNWIKFCAAARFQPHFGTIITHISQSVKIRLNILCFVNCFCYGYWGCAASSLHIASDTSNYEDTFDFIEIDGYYAISLTTASGTFYIGENPGQDPFALVHTVMMPRITSLCMVPDCCLWEIFETASGEYSFRNVESQYFLYSTGDVLRTTKLDVILGNPAMYPCFWNILNAASNELNMPVNLNQKYSGIEDSYIFDYGCCLCCIGNVLSYYSTKNYSVNELVDNGWWIWHYNQDDNGNWIPVWKEAKWTVPQDIVNFHDYTPFNENTDYATIKEEIDKGYPVILHCKGVYKGKLYEHWTVAYKYINNCQGTKDIFVLDPANYAEPNNSCGLFIPLSQSMQTNHNQWINGYKKTSPKK